MPYSRHITNHSTVLLLYHTHDFYIFFQQFFPTEMIDVENHEELRGLNINLAHFLQVRLVLDYS